MATKNARGEEVLSDLAEDEIPEKVEFQSREESLERFLEVFERSARRWEMIVYPALFGFILLAGYGFFLIYSLTSDMKTIAQSLDPQMGIHMSDFTSHLGSMSGSVESMSLRVTDMSENMTTISDQMNYLSTMPTITDQMAGMNRSMTDMSGNMNMLRSDMGMLNRNVSKPMSMMNSFMPW